VCKNDARWPKLYGKFIFYPKFKSEWRALPRIEGFLFLADGSQRGVLAGEACQQQTMTMFIGRRPLEAAGGQGGGGRSHTRRGK
jgi:hypothetical protein